MNRIIYFYYFIWFCLQ